MKKQDRALKAKGYRQTDKKEVAGFKVESHKCNNGHDHEIRTHTVKTDKRTWARSTVIPASSMK